MIEIKKAEQKFKDSNNILNEAYVCFDKNNILGFLEYNIKDKELFILKINSDENIISDGLVRQTMSMALDNGCEICKYDNKIKDKLFKLKIINDLSADSINILDFFLKINHI